MDLSRVSVCTKTMHTSAHVTTAMDQAQALAAALIVLTRKTLQRRQKMDLVTQRSNLRTHSVPLHLRNAVPAYTTSPLAFVRSKSIQTTGRVWSVLDQNPVSDDALHALIHLLLSLILLQTLMLALWISMTVWIPMILCALST
jgi:hypothetical protein